jgi:D-arabinose 1-dehydrogenase-like Zn-dependent alcohol dehydrogenase
MGSMVNSVTGGQGDGLNLASLFLKNIAIVGSTMGTEDEFESALAVINSKRIV